MKNVLEHISNAMRAAVIVGMKVVRQHQGGRIGSSVKMADQSLVTPVDQQSQRAMLEILSKISETCILAEESDDDIGGERYVLLVDPLDGTRPFANGLMTSTVIASVYDQKLRRIVDCWVGEPATGRMWHAGIHTPTTLEWHAFDGTNTVPPQRVSVWNGKDTPGNPDRAQQTVLLDAPHGFVRKGRRVLSDTEAADLLASISRDMRVMIPGSNGLNHALVANGGERLAGSVTFIIGGSWDVAGVLLVEKAGGFARAFLSEENGFIECDPLNVMNYDLLVTGNTKTTVDLLAKKVLSLRKH